MLFPRLVSYDGVMCPHGDAAHRSSSRCENEKERGFFSRLPPHPVLEARFAKKRMLRCAGQEYDSEDQFHIPRFCSDHFEAYAFASGWLVFLVIFVSFINVALCTSVLDMRVRNWGCLAEGKIVFFDPRNYTTHRRKLNVPENLRVATERKSLRTWLYLNQKDKSKTRFACKPMYI